MSQAQVWPRVHDFLSDILHCHHEAGAVSNPHLMNKKSDIRKISQFICSLMARGKCQNMTPVALLMPKPVAIGNPEHGTGCVCQRPQLSHSSRKTRELCAISGSAPSPVPCNFPPDRLFCDPETSAYLPHPLLCSKQQFISPGGMVPASPREPLRRRQQPMPVLA